jgi:hypothetical protein
MNERQAPAIAHAATLLILLLACALFAPTVNARAQSGKSATNKPAPPAQSPAPTSAALLKRTTTRRETRRFGYGGTLTVYGAPEGSITIESWSKGEIEITAEVELSAPTEDELSRMASVNSFLLDDDLNHVRLITTGTHDRAYMKRVARDFPKKLLTMPWRIDYHIRVPAHTDLEIYAGRGPLTLSGVEGALRLNAGESKPAVFDLAGGDAEATITGGVVRLRVGTRNWRGRGANFRLGRGDLTVELPADFNGDVDAEVLRNGRVENSHTGLTPRERAEQTDRHLRLRAGAGGAPFSFTVGDGTLRIVARASSSSSSKP